MRGGFSAPLVDAGTTAGRAGQLTVLAIVALLCCVPAALRAWREYRAARPRYMQRPAHRTPVLPMRRRRRQSDRQGGTH